METCFPNRLKRHLLHYVAGLLDPSFPMYWVISSQDVPSSITCSKTAIFNSSMSVCNLSAEIIEMMSGFISFQTSCHSIQLGLDIFQTMKLSTG
jgi:hypothetical protein